jgi:hypothetical protein
MHLCADAFVCVQVTPLIQFFSLDLAVFVLFSFMRADDFFVLAAPLHAIDQGLLFA